MHSVGAGCFLWADVPCGYVKAESAEMERVGRHPQKGWMEMIQEIITKEAWEIIDHECGHHPRCKGCAFVNEHGDCTVNILCEKVRVLDKEEH